MNYQDIIILAVVFLIIGSIIYFSFIKPAIKKESPCCKCSYLKDCKNNTKCNKN